MSISNSTKKESKIKFICTRSREAIFLTKKCLTTHESLLRTTTYSSSQRKQSVLVLFLKWEWLYYIYLLLLFFKKTAVLISPFDIWWEHIFRLTFLFLSFLFFFLSFFFFLFFCDQPPSWYNHLRLRPQIPKPAKRNEPYRGLNITRWETNVFHTLNRSYIFFITCAISFHECLFGKGIAWKDSQFPTFKYQKMKERVNALNWFFVLRKNISV